MAITLVASVQATSASNNGCTSVAIDTTVGSINAIVFITNQLSSASPSIGDSVSNAYTTKINDTDNPGYSLLQVRVCYNPTLNAAHTWHITGAVTLGSLIVLCYSGVDTAIPAIAGTFAKNPSGSAFQAGPITPTVNGSMLIQSATVVGLGSPDSPGTYTVNSGFTVEKQQGSDLTGGNSHYGLVASDFTQAVAANLQPTTTYSNSTQGWGTATIALSPITGTDANVNLSGVSATAAAGTLTAAGNASFTLSGVSATAAVGSLGHQNDYNFSLVGISAAAVAGSFGIQNDFHQALVGVSATAQAGSFAASASATFALLGVQVNAFAGTLYPTQVILTVPMITIMDDIPIPGTGEMSDDDIPMLADLPRQIAFEAVLNTNPIPMTGTMYAVPVPGEGSVP